MPLQVIHSHQGNAKNQGQALGHINPHQQGSRQPRTVGNGYSLDIFQRGVGLPQGLGNHGHYLDDVLSRGHFGDHPSVAAMYLHLGGDNVGQETPSVLHHGHGRLVAGGLYAQNPHDHSIVARSLRGEGCASSTLQPLSPSAIIAL